MAVSLVVTHKYIYNYYYFFFFLQRSSVGVNRLTLNSIQVNFACHKNVLA